MGVFCDAGTVGSLMRASVIVERYREKKEGTADERRSYYNNIINIFRPQLDTCKNAPAQGLDNHLTMKSQILKEDQKLNYNNPISPPGKGRGELEITDVNNYYIDQGRMGYKVLDGFLTRCGDVWEFVEKSAAG